MQCDVKNVKNWFGYRRKLFRKNNKIQFKRESFPLNQPSKKEIIQLKEEEKEEELFGEKNKLIEEKIKTMKDIMISSYYSNLVINMLFYYRNMPNLIKM